MVTGTANRTLLTKEILDFCGVLPIYNTKRYPDKSTTSGVAGSKGILFFEIARDPVILLVTFCCRLKNTG